MDDRGRVELLLDDGRSRAAGRERVAVVDRAVDIVARLREVDRPRSFGSRATACLERFHAEHDRTYGFSAPGEPVEAVSLRLTSIGRIAKPPARRLEPGGQPEPKERRPVYFAEAGDYVDCPIYDRYALAAGATLAGPAVVEEFDSTTVVHPGFALRVDDTGNLIIEREAT